jgi:uncharacterized membrane protein
MNRARPVNWLLVTAIVTATLLRLVTLNRKSLWLDEVVTLQIAQDTWSNIITNRWDPHPPLYYLLMHAWISLGQNEFVLRLPSAIAGIIAIPLLYWLAREWVDKWSAMAAVWMLTLAPLHIWYSQETRMYALACTLGLASTWAYSVAIRRDSWLAWSAWVAATVLGLYISYSTFLLLAAQIVFLVPICQFKGKGRRTLLTALAALIGVVLLFLPQMGTLTTQVVASFRGAYYYVPVQQWLASNSISADATVLNAVILLVGLFLLACASIVAWVLLRRVGHIRIGVVLVGLTVLAYEILLPASVVMRGLGIKRQLLVLFPYGLVFVAAVIGAYRYRRRLLIGLAIQTLLFAGYTSLVLEQENWRGVAEWINARALANDVVLFDASYAQMGFDYYYHSGIPRQGVGPSDVPTKLESLTTSRQNVWLVLENDIYTDPHAIVRRWLDENRNPTQEFDFAGVRVILYNRAE